MLTLHKLVGSEVDLSSLLAACSEASFGRGQQEVSSLHWLPVWLDPAAYPQ